MHRAQWLPPQGRKGAQSKPSLFQMGPGGTGRRGRTPEVAQLQAPGRRSCQDDSNVLLLVMVVTTVLGTEGLRISRRIVCPGTLELDPVEHLPEVEQVGSVQVALLLAQLDHVHGPLGHVVVQCDLVPLQVERLDA